MKGMLNMNEGQRFTAMECLDHPYFEGMHSDITESLISGYHQHKQQNQLSSAGMLRNRDTSQNNKSRVSIKQSTVQSTDVIKNSIGG